MQTNLTLIGMPGAGKSTVGIILAKNLSLGFIDTDVLIQINQQKSLQQILDESGHLALRAIEEAAICKLNLSRIVFLEVSFAEINRRIRNFSTRGIAKAKEQTFRELFDERQALYKTYAELTIACDGMDQEEVAQAIIRLLPPDYPH